MTEFLALLADHLNLHFPVWYYGCDRHDLVGADLLLALISDYFDGDMAIEVNTYYSYEGNYDIEYRAWLAERQKV